MLGDEEATILSDKDLGSYRLKEEVEIVIGEGDSLLSELFDKVVITMKEGENAYIKTKVDANCNKVDEVTGQKLALKFNIQLKSVSRAADITDLEPDEKLDRAEQHKEKGTAIYQMNNIEFGLRRFRKAIQYLESIQSLSGLSSSMIARMNTLSCHCNLNLAAGYLKQEMYEKVIEHCNKALYLEPKNVKGLFRRGQAYAKMHKYDEAKSDVLLAKELDGENKAVISLLKTIDTSIKKEREMYQKMFSH